MTTYPHYYDLDDKAPETVNVVFEDDEIRRIYALAEIWAERCQAVSIKPPPDPLRALLAAAENLFEVASIMDALHERATLEADDGLIQ